MRLEYTFLLEVKQIVIGVGSKVRIDVGGEGNSDDDEKLEYKLKVKLVLGLT